MMKFKIWGVILLSLILSGCAEMTALNQRVGDWAEQANRSLGMMSTTSIARLTIDDSTTSARQIDTLYIRLKREFGFMTREEAIREHGGSKGSNNRLWAEEVLIGNGFIHDATPGVYYHLADSFNYGYLSLVLEKEDKRVLVKWSVKTNDKAKAAQIKQRILKII
ncbi:hypothetical protein [Pasteurella testudinis]|uniref:hypothetical protein n=1 Tax=Pasteurella testudinis TaxID=761 RepID=UPI0040594E72